MNVTNMMRDSMANNEMEQRNLLGEEVDVASAKTQMEEERAASSRFLKIEDGEIAELHLTGQVYRNKNDYGNEVFNFVLTEQNAKGENKIFSIGVKNGFSQTLMGKVVDGEQTVKIIRTGTGMDTRYQEVKEKK